jgi:hypothetical protein
MVKDRVPRLEPFWPLLVLHLADRRRENGCTSIMIRGLWAGKGHRYIPKIETWAMAHFAKLWQIITSHHHP